MKLFLLATFSILFVLTSCKKDGNFPPSGEFIHNPNCNVEFDYTINSPVGGIEYYEDSFQFKTPTFNPNNSDEIVFQYVNHNTYSFQVRKHTISTGENQILADNFYLESPAAWNAAGKIALGSINGEIWLVDDNGSNLTPFNSSGANWKPSWAFQNKLVWNRVEQETGYRYIFIQSQGQLYPDTLINSGQGLNNFVISNNNTFIAYSGDYNFYNLHLTPNSSYTFSDLETIPFQLIGNRKGLCWHPSGTKFYASVTQAGPGTESALYEVKYPSGVATKLIQYCHSKQYANISCSADGKFLLLERFDYRQDFNTQGLFEGNIEIKTSVYLFNLNTMKETKLNLE